MEVCNNIIKLGFGQFIKERKPNQAVGISFSICKSFRRIMLEIKRGSVQAKIVEHRVNIFRFEISDKGRTLLKALAKDVKHVGIVCGIARQIRKFDIVLNSQWLQRLVVSCPYLHSSILYVVNLFNLCP